MSRLGPSVRPLVLGPAVPAFALLPADTGRPPLPAALVVACALVLDAVAFVASPSLAGVMAPPLLPAVDGRAALLLLPLGVAGVAALGGYRPSTLLDSRAALGSALGGAVAGLLAVALAIALLLGPGHFHGVWPELTAALMLSGVLAGRSALTAWMVRHPQRRFAPRTVIVGGGPATGRLAELLRDRDNHVLRIVGFVADAVVPGTDETDGLAYLGPTEQVLTLARRGLVDRVVLALPWSDEARIQSIARRLADYPVEVCLAPDVLGYTYAGRTRIAVCGLPLGGLPVLHLAERPMAGWAGAVKRTEDLLVGALALLICAIPMAVIALAIRLDSPGPVLFRQRRTGFANRDFEMLKFRSMYHHMADHEVRQQTTRNDPRVTRVGALLRRTSLDELPQIFNVLRGDMSIVGPRPHAPGTSAGGRTFEQVVDRYAARHRVRPGLTGLAQVRGLRGETRTEDRIIRRVESDLEYIETWSLWLDLSILARTAIIVLRMKNAY